MTLTKFFTKKKICIGLISIWIIFSSYYIINDLYQNFKIKYAQNAYQKGVGDSVKTLITQVEKCVKVPLYDGDKKVEVVSMTCLTQAQDKEKQQPKEKQK